jgi:hypothetical protein
MEWIERLRPLSPANVQLLAASSSGDEVGRLTNEGDLSEYLAVIDKYPSACFDIIIVDGHERLGAVVAALPHLKEEGLLILDNSDRVAHQSALRYLKDVGFTRIDFYGIVPASGIPACTSVFGRSLSRWSEGDAAITTWGA